MWPAHICPLTNAQVCVLIQAPKNSSSDEQANTLLLHYNWHPHRYKPLYKTQARWRHFIPRCYRLVEPVGGWLCVCIDRRVCAPAVWHAAAVSGWAEAGAVPRLPGPSDNEGHREHHHHRGGESQWNLRKLPWVRGRWGSRSCAVTVIYVHNILLLLTHMQRLMPLLYLCAKNGA